MNQVQASRVADRWAAKKRQRKKNRKRVEQVTLQDFLEGPGKDVEVVSPITGNKIKLPTLNTKRYRTNTRAKSILRREYEKWRKTQEEPEEKEEEPEEEDAEEEDAEEGDDDSERVELEDPKQMVPEPDIEGFLGESKTHQKVIEELKAGRSPRRKDVTNALSLTVRALTKDDISETELERLQATEKWLKQVAGMKEDSGRGRRDDSALPDLTPKNLRNLQQALDADEREVKRLQQVVRLPGGGEASKSLSEMREILLKELEADQAKRVRDMDDDEFQKVLDGLLGKKKASLRTRVIRLAFAREDLRPHLLALLGEAR